MEFQIQNKSPGPKDKHKNCKGIQVRRSTKQKIEHSIQDEPVVEFKGKKHRRLRSSKNLNTFQRQKSYRMHQQRKYQESA